MGFQEEIADDFLQFSNGIGLPPKDGLRTLVSTVWCQLHGTEEENLAILMQAQNRALKLRDEVCRMDSHALGLQLIYCQGPPPPRANLARADLCESDDESDNESDEDGDFVDSPMSSVDSPMSSCEGCAAFIGSFLENTYSTSPLS